jgi:hypothetical protein
VRASGRSMREGFGAVGRKVADGPCRTLAAHTEPRLKPR